MQKQQLGTRPRSCSEWSLDFKVSALASRLWHRRTPLIQCAEPPTLSSVSSTSTQNRQGQTEPLELWKGLGCQPDPATSVVPLWT